MMLFGAIMAENGSQPTCGYCVPTVVHKLPLLSLRLTREVDAGC